MQAKLLLRISVWWEKPFIDGELPAQLTQAEYLLKRIPREVPREKRIHGDPFVSPRYYKDEGRLKKIYVQTDRKRPI